MLKTLLFSLLLLFVALPATACFGPKLYIATPVGEDGELLFHLAAIYLHEKTGVDAIRFELTEELTAETFLQQEQVDLAFQPRASQTQRALLQVGDELWLLTGPRPTDDLQFSTVPKAFAKLQRLLKPQDLAELRQQVAAGVLPAAAVRQLYQQRSWI